MILDCGVNSVGQMRRLFGVEGTNHILKNLFCVWISHFHSDHSLGLAVIMEERLKVTDRRLNVLCDHITHGRTIVKEPLYGEDYFKADFKNRNDVFKYGNIQLRSTPVHHDFRGTSMACEITFDSKYKLVMSGDRNAFYEDIEKEFKSTDILIHEATFKDDSNAEEEDHCDRVHSTFSEAVESGKKLNAKFEFLNHCSQRYDLNEFCLPKHPNVMFAYDYLTINYDTIDHDFPIIKENVESFNSSQEK